MDKGKKKGKRKKQKKEPNGSPTIRFAHSSPQSNDARSSTTHDISASIENETTCLSDRYRKFDARHSYHVASPDNDRPFRT